MTIISPVKLSKVHGDPTCMISLKLLNEWKLISENSSLYLFNCIKLQIAFNNMRYTQTGGNQNVKKSRVEYKLCIFFPYI